MIFGFIGGDMRQIIMANELAISGHRINAYGLEKHLLHKDCTIYDSLYAIFSDTVNIVFPVPVPNDMDLSLITWKHKVFGGMIPQKMRTYFKENDVEYYDFMKDDEVAIYNSIATAEGTIAEAITGATINLHDSNSIVLGYGKCGKTLAKKLSGLSSKVTISTRNPIALAESNAMGYETIELKDLKNHINKFNFIFNTIPAPVLTKEILDSVSRDALIIDIASKPGGTDFEYGRKLGLDIRHCLSLPGIYSPKSSALYLNKLLLEFHKSRFSE